MDPAIQPHQPTHEQHAGRAAYLKEPSKQALEASRAAEAPASTSSKSYQRAHALTQAVPSGAAHLDCVRRASTSARESGLTMSDAPEPEISFFGHFLFS